jgi:rod shape-determining protein MreD|tara:strand:+ start:2136 stop:2636 length:501 start_codon:yes stop_codon:yes gene_type:complete
MTREFIKNSFFYTSILVSQLLIFNHFNLFDIITPSVYLIIFILYKTTYSKTFLIFLGFITGLIIDFAMQTYGIHAFATITICYLRERIEKNSFGINANLPSAMIKGTQMINRLTFFMLIILIHSSIYYSLVFFNTEILGKIFFYTIINSIVTFIITWIFTQLISNN